MSFGERFLAVDAAAFEASGAPGAERVVVELPGGPYAVSGLAPAHAAALQRRFGERCSAAAPAPDLVAVEVHAAPAGAYRSLDTRGWEYTLDLDPSAGDVRIAGLGLFARVELGAAARAHLWVAPNGGGGGFAGACENLLRVLVAYRLLERGGAMVHAAGVAAHGAAAVAVGRSGAGKSTFARAAAAASATVLSDDLVGLLPGPGGPCVVPLPFTGDLPPAPVAVGPLPLAALLRLEQAPLDELLPLGGAETLGMLLACAPAVNVDPFRRDALLAALGGLAAAAAGAAWALRCTPAGGWPLAAALLARGRRG